MSDNGAEQIENRVLLKVQLAASVERVERSENETTSDIRWVFANESLRVGRSSEHSQFVIHDPAMSKRHYEIHFDGNRCTITDLDSANGTRVNGVLIDGPVDLADNDEICAGTTIFSVGFFRGSSSQADKKDTSDTFRISSNNTDTSNNMGDSDDTGEIVAQTTELETWKFVTLKLGPQHTAQATSDSLCQLKAWIRPAQRMVVGSSTYEADWQLPADWGMSPVHFEISFNGHSCLLRSRDGKQETLVNGQPTSEGRVKNGDTITAGNVDFIVEFAK